MRQECSMYHLDNGQGPIERDPRNDPRRQDDERVVERKPIAADRPADESQTWPDLPADRRRTERRRIERMGTDI
jgi:hypothetical protein